MTPKFIELTRRICGKPGTKVMVNPRRVDTFSPGDPTNADSPAILNFGRGDFICVMETVSQIKTLLNK